MLSSGEFLRKKDHVGCMSGQWRGACSKDNIILRSPINRTHLSTEQLFRAGPKAAEAGPKKTPKDPLGIAPERISFKASSGGVFASFRSKRKLPWAI